MAGLAPDLMALEPKVNRCLVFLCASFLYGCRYIWVESVSGLCW